MRTKALLAFLISYWAGAMAQAEDNYLPFVEEGKTWTVKFTDMYEDQTSYRYMYYIIKGDTIIDGKLYKKMYRKTSGDDWQSSFALRDDGGKVYCKPYLSGMQEYLWYDFNAKAGDTMEATEEGSSITLSITGTDYVYVQGHKRKRIHIDLTRRSVTHKGVWVEGIGSDYGPDIPHSWGLDRYFIPSMEECSMEGQVLFTYDDFNAVAWSEEKTGLEAQHTVMPQPSANIYDLQGRRIRASLMNCEKGTVNSGSLKKGVYIRDGKKYVR